MTRSFFVFLLFIAFVALCRAHDHICPPHGYYRVANPRSKVSFYVCNNGYADLNYCPNGYNFDSQEADCVAASEYIQTNKLDYDRNTHGNYGNQQSQYKQNNNYNNYNDKYSEQGRYGNTGQQQQPQSRNYQQNGYGNNAPSRNHQQNGNGNNAQRQNSRNYQQNGYSNNAQQQNTGSYQQNDYRNSVQRQNSGNYQQNRHNKNAQQQSSYRNTQYQNRKTQQQSNTRSELETDPEVNRQSQDRLRAGNNNIQRVICPRVITRSSVLMPNEEDQTQTTYYVCQKSGARRLLRCPEGTKFNVGLKVCYSSTVSADSNSRSVSRKQNANQHW